MLMLLPVTDEEEQHGAEYRRHAAEVVASFRVDLVDVPSYRHP